MSRRGVGIVLCAALWSCAADEEEPPGFTVGEVEVRGSGERAERGWLPQEETVEGWVRRGLGESERGLRQGEEGQEELRGTVRYTAYILSRPKGSTLRVDVDVQLEGDVWDGQTVALMVSRQKRQALSQRRPDDELLRPMSRALVRQAVEEAVEEARDQAEVEVATPEELRNWILGDGSTSARKRAIRRARWVDDDQTLGAVVAVARHGEDELSVAAARVLLERGSPEAGRALMRIAKQLSRDRKYDEYLEVLPLLNGLDEAWIDLYLQTVAEAHRAPRVRKRAQELVAGRGPVGSRSE